MNVCKHRERDIKQHILNDLLMVVSSEENKGDLHISIFYNNTFVYYLHNLKNLNKLILK